VVASRSEAVPLGLVRLVEGCRRERIGAEIVEGYRRRPQADGEVGWAEARDKRRPVLIVTRSELFGTALPDSTATGRAERPPSGDLRGRAPG